MIHSPNKQAEEKGKWEGTVKSLKYDSAAAIATKKPCGAAGEKLGSPDTEIAKQRIVWLYQIGIWDIGSMMFLGMALLGIGFFSITILPDKIFDHCCCIHCHWCSLCLVAVAL